MSAQRFRYWKGVRYVAPHRPAPATFARCLTCFRAWNDDKPTAWTPTPSGRCPFEYWHRYRDPLADFKAEFRRMFQLGEGRRPSRAETSAAVRAWRMGGGG